MEADTPQEEILTTGNQALDAFFNAMTSFMSHLSKRIDDLTDHVHNFCEAVGYHFDEHDEE